MTHGNPQVIHNQHLQCANPVNNKIFLRVSNAFACTCRMWKRISKNAGCNRLHFNLSSGHQGRKNKVISIDNGLVRRQRIVVGQKIRHRFGDNDADSIHG
jgi:hypothetical protein